MLDSAAYDELQKRTDALFSKVPSLTALDPMQVDEMSTLAQGMLTKMKYRFGHMRMSHTDATPASHMRVSSDVRLRGMAIATLRSALLQTVFPDADMAARFDEATQLGARESDKQAEHIQFLNRRDVRDALQAAMLAVHKLAGGIERGYAQLAPLVADGVTDFITDYNAAAVMLSNTTEEAGGASHITSTYSTSAEAA